MNRRWPDPEDGDLREWARQLVQQLIKKDQDDSQPKDVGEIREFIILPEGWLACTGGTFEAVAFPRLNLILGGTTLPTLAPVYDPGYVVGIKAG